MLPSAETEVSCWQNVHVVKPICLLLLRLGNVDFKFYTGRSLDAASLRNRKPFPPPESAGIDRNGPETPGVHRSKKGVLCDRVSLVDSVWKNRPRLYGLNVNRTSFAPHGRRVDAKQRLTFRRPLKTREINYRFFRIIPSGFGKWVCNGTRLAPTENVFPRVVNTRFIPRQPIIYLTSFIFFVGINRIQTIGVSAGGAGCASALPAKSDGRHRRALTYATQFT